MEHPLKRLSLGVAMLASVLLLLVSCDTAPEDVDSGQTLADAGGGMDAGADAAMPPEDAGTGLDAGSDTGVTDSGLGIDAAGCMTGEFGTSTFGGSCWGT